MGAWTLICDPLTVDSNIERVELVIRLRQTHFRIDQPILDQHCFWNYEGNFQADMMMDITPTLGRLCQEASQFKATFVYYIEPYLQK